MPVGWLTDEHAGSAGAFDVPALAGSKSLLPHHPLGVKRFPPTLDHEVCKQMWELSMVLSVGEWGPG